MLWHGEYFGLRQPLRPAEHPNPVPKIWKLRFTTLEVPITAPNPTVTMFSRQAVLRTARAAAPQRTIASQVRTFAAPASSEKVKAPIALFGLDGTYATALVIRPRHIYIQLGTWKGA